MKKQMIIYLISYMVAVKINLVCSKCVPSNFQCSGYQDIVCSDWHSFTDIDGCRHTNRYNSGKDFHVNLRIQNDPLYIVTPSLFKYVNHYINYNQHITALTLSNCAIVSVMPSAFAELPSLKQLYLDHNNITNFNPDVFFAARQLETLDLSYNHISNLTEASFSSMTKLTFLDLSHNRIKFLPHEVFQNQQQLMYLNLSYNSLEEISKYVFHPLANCTELDLEFNNITTLDFDDIILHLRKLTIFEIDGNIWECISLYETMEKFRKRDISTTAGRYFKAGNVNGIKCVENEFEEKTLTNLTPKSLDDNKVIKTSLMYKFLNSDFKNSNFYKFLENLRLAQNSTSNINDNFRNLSFYKYFDSEFKQTEFYKYLENFNKLQIELKFANNNGSTMNVKQEADTGTYTNNFIYRFFNKDFQNSSFFRFFSNYSLDTSDSNFKMQENMKLQNMSKMLDDYSSVSTILIFILIALLLILASFIVKQLGLRKKFKTETRSDINSLEQVELMQ